MLKKFSGYAATLVFSVALLAPALASAQSITIGVETTTVPSDTPKYLIPDQCNGNVPVIIASVATVGVPYRADASSKGSIAGAPVPALPAGLTANGNYVEGTPMVAGTFSSKMYANNPCGAILFNITVSNTSVPTPTPNPTQPITEERGVIIEHSYSFTEEARAQIQKIEARAKEQIEQIQERARAQIRQIEVRAKEQIRKIIATQPKIPTASITSELKVFPNAPTTVFGNASNVSQVNITIDYPPLGTMGSSSGSPRDSSVSTDIPVKNGTWRITYPQGYETGNYLITVRATSKNGSILTTGTLIVATPTPNSCPIYSPCPPGFTGNITKNSNGCSVLTCSTGPNPTQPATATIGNVQLFDSVLIVSGEASNIDAVLVVTNFGAFKVTVTNGRWTRNILVPPLIGGDVIINVRVLSSINGLPLAEGNFPIRLQTSTTLFGAAAITAFDSLTEEVSLPEASPGTSYSYTFTQDLYRGQTGAEVSDLQDALKEMGLYRGEVTGNFYDQTRKAVMAFQTKYGIKATGYAGQMTREKLNSLLGQ